MKPTIEEIKEMIAAFYRDTSRSKEETLDGLYGLYNDVVMRIESLLVNGD